MRPYLSLHTRRIILTSPILLLTASAKAQELTLDFGLEDPKDLYEEISATSGQTSAYSPPRARGEKLLRYFMHSKAYGDNALPLWDRAQRLYDVYRTDGGAPNAVEFAAYLRAQDRGLADNLKRIAPRLWFRFIGSDVEHVLTAITIKVLDYSEYRGGGFFDQEAWYDVVLEPRRGTYRHGVDTALRFKGTGRARLRFFSNNFYESAGMSPMGAYIINLTFEFLKNTRIARVSTGPFKIDV